MLSTLLITVVIALGPWIERGWRCYRLEGEMLEIAERLQQLRLEASQRGETIVVLIDIENEELVAFLDRADVEGVRGSDLLLGPTDVLDETTGRTVGVVDRVLARWSLRRSLGDRVLRLGSAADEGADPRRAVEGFTTGPVADPRPRLVFEPTGDLRDAGSLAFVLAPGAEKADDPSERPSFSAVSFDQVAPPRARVQWYAAEPVGMAGYYSPDNLPEGARWCF